MTYSALPDRRMPYDNDGTVTLQADNNPVFGSNQSYPSGATNQAWNGASGISTQRGYGSNAEVTTWFFFPEQRETSAAYYSLPVLSLGYVIIKGSNDTTNGIDGTWETATSTTITQPAVSADDWRTKITTVSFTGPKRVVRIQVQKSGGTSGLCIMHWYGQKAAGQTPEDIVYLDGSSAYAEFTAPVDFGDVPLGTTQQHLFKVKNASATKTANTINIQCNDADFAISSDGVTWVVTINIASLAAGASSGVLYVRNTTPSPGGVLGPRFARIVTTVASYT